MKRIDKYREFIELNQSFTDAIWEHYVNNCLEIDTLMVGLMNLYCIVNYFHKSCKKLASACERAFLHAKLGRTPLKYT